MAKTLILYNRKASFPGRRQGSSSTTMAKEGFAAGGVRDVNAVFQEVLKMALIHGAEHVSYVTLS